MICPKCDREFEDTCVCGYKAKKSQSQINPDDFIRMKSGNRLVRCTWMLRERCCLPVTGTLPGQPPLCAWHRTWLNQLGTARHLEDTIERPAFDSWWNWRMEAYPQTSLWGLSKEEYWRYSHGQKIHDPQPDYLPVVQEHPAYITREEFGADLFEAIKLKAGSNQARKTATIYKNKELFKEAEHAEKMAEALQRQLQTILNRNTISTADIKRLLALT